MVLDNKTIAFTTIFNGFLLTALLFAYSLYSKARRAFSFWTLGIGLISLGYGLLSTQGEWPSWISIIVANLCLLLGRSSLNFGLRSYYEIKNTLFGTYGFLVAFHLVTFILFTYVWSSIEVRIMIQSFLTVLISLDGLRLNPRYDIAENSLVFVNLIKFIFLLNAVFYFFRIIVTFYAPPEYLLYPSLMTSMTFILTNVSLVAWTLGLLLLSSMDLQGTTLKLEELNETKDRFFSIVAHDLRGPIGNMAAILSYLSNENNLENEEGRKALRMLGASSKLTFSFLENLLHWARSQKGEIAFQMENLDIHKIVDDVFGVLAPQAFNKKITLKKELPQNLILYGDERSIHTTFYNLLSNAIKFTPVAGEVSFFAEEHEKEIRFIVRDNGIGMDPAFQKNLFDFTKKTVRIGTAGEKGSGLGLLLCKEFTEKNGGEFSILSETRHGTSVILKFKKKGHASAAS